MWDDGNDVAHWSAATVDTAIVNRTAPVPYLYSDWMHQMYVPATAIRVTLGVDPGSTSAAHMTTVGYTSLTISGYLRFLQQPHFCLPRNPVASEFAH